MNIHVNPILNVFTSLSFPDLAFYFLAVVILLCSAVVVFSKNIVHSGFSLLGTFTGVAGLYGLLAANFIAAVQILVYVGGVLIVILFAIMLTRGIQNTRITNPASGLAPAIAVGVVVAAMLIVIAFAFPWRLANNPEWLPSVHQIGHALLSTFLIPFELLSVLLLAVLVGAVMLVRKEIKSEAATEAKQ